MRLITKITWLSAALGVAMIAILVALSLFSFRYFSLTTAEDLSRTAAEIVRVGLTESMINGVVDKRASFLKRLEGIEGLQTVRIARGPLVERQFGPGLEMEQPRDAIDDLVLATGEPYFDVEEQSGFPIFRATIPYRAQDTGIPNCLTCHQVERDSVLGAVSLTISIDHLRQQALVTVGFMLIPVVFFAGLLVVFYRRTIQPLSDTASDLQAAVEGALEGDFTARIETRTSDEIGQIAGEVNQLMGFLYDGLDGISRDVGQLTQCEVREGNMLASTKEMVGRLVDAAHFKQSIEEDETRVEVYDRLGRVIRDEFEIWRFSIYEVANSKNRIAAVNVDGVLDGDCHWCDRQILIRSETCRARRTGHAIDAVETPAICSAFMPHEGDDLSHICLPVIQSGSVGSVVQLVFPSGEGAEIQQKVPYLNVYLNESAPVIEAKRLMDTLRESTLRDAMTGLHNRRFLEEYIDSVVAGAKRRDKQLSILMLDLDFFKKVNDTHGHDAGDGVLKELARILARGVRASDLCIRYGGEEFLIILQDTVERYGDGVAEKIRASVEATKFAVPGGVIKKTISIGVADFPRDSDTFWQALKYADVALYKAKERGRNQVIHFEEGMWVDKEEY